MSIAPDVIPDDALDSDIAIIAKKGRGKTYTAKGIVERLLRMERRVLVLDPLAVWWGLKASADGERAGFPIAVFGGPHGDMPPTTAFLPARGFRLLRPWTHPPPRKQASGELSPKRWPK